MLRGAARSSAEQRVRPCPCTLRGARCDGSTGGPGGRERGRRAQEEEAEKEGSFALLFGVARRCVFLQAEVKTEEEERICKLLVEILVNRLERPVMQLRSCSSTC